MRISKWIPLFLALALPGIRAHAEPAARLLNYWAEKDAHVSVFSPDGKFLVSTSGEGDRLRETATGRIRAELTSRPHCVNGAAFSPDGSLLFAKVYSERHKPVGVQDLKVWTVASGAARATFPYISEGINVATDHFALSRDGKTLVFADNAERLPMQLKRSKGGIDRFEVEFITNVNPGLPRLKLWDVAEWKERAVLEAGAPMAFSPDGKTLVTAARDWKDTTAKIWDAETGRLVRQFDSGSPWAKPLVFSPDGSLLAIGVYRSPLLYELKSGRTWTIHALGNTSSPPIFSREEGLLFPDGVPWLNPQVAQGGGCLCYDVSSLPPARLDLLSGELAISPDGTRYAAVLGRRGSSRVHTVFLIDLPSRQETGRLEVEGLEGMSFSPDGKWLALLVGRHLTAPGSAQNPYVRSIQLVDPRTSRVQIVVPSPADTWGNYGWRFSPNSRFLAVFYRTGSNIHHPGEPDPTDRPMTLEIWEILP